MRTGGIVLAVVCLVAAIAAASQSAPAPKPLSLKVVSAKQADVQKQRAVAVRLKARKTGLWRVHVRSGKRVITLSRQVRLKRGKARTVRLRLSRSAGCVGTRLTAHAVPLTGRTKRAGRSVLARRSLRAAPCNEPKPIPFEVENADRCDFIDSAVCLFPWPNDHFTVSDGTTVTKRRLNLQAASMPQNRSGVPVDPEPYNRNDGFSPGALIVTKVPGLESQKAFDRTRAVPITDMARAYDDRQPVVVINTKTKQRHLIWAEIDSIAKEKKDVTLLIRPGVNFDEGTRYIVALRSLRGEDGKLLAAPRAFQLYRDRVITASKDVESRRGHFESLFSTLADAGIDRDSLYRAWDFTVASEKNLSERVLAIRDDAFKQLGDTNLSDLKVQGRAPEFEIEKVTPNPEDQLAARVEGRYTVPCYLNTPNCMSGGTFDYPEGSKHGPPVLTGGGTTTARFQCNIPKVAGAPGTSRPSLYGHGLLGSRGEANQGQLRDFGNEHNMIFCATDWVGMSCADLPDTDPSPGAVADFLEKAGRNQLPNCDYQTVVTILEDMSNFPKLADRVQQGLVNFLYLGRLLIHPDGFSKDANFQKAGKSMIDTRRLFYDGNSQGGIIGGALAAVGVDHDRAVLGVPGMNYSTLLTRSTDWGTGKQPEPGGLPEYAYYHYTAYPNQLERQLIFSIVQTLWDRAEANGYAHHMTDDPLPNTPPHRVMLHVGLGDHQVAQVSAEVEARTMGGHARVPYVDRGRDSDKNPHYALPAIPRFPFAGSALVLWDIGPKRIEGGETVGTHVPPSSNLPPGEQAGQDPHEFPRRSKEGRAQKSAFLQIGGNVIDVCGMKPCYAGTWKGPGR